MANVTVDITAQNTWTDSIRPRLGNLAISISTIGTSNTVTVQRSFDNSNWVDVKTYDEVSEENIVDPTQFVFYRIGVATGNYGSGTVTVTLVG